MEQDVEHDEEWADEEREEGAGIVSSCTVSIGQTKTTCQMRPLFRAAPAAFRSNGAAWPPPPSAITASSQSLIRWLKLAVQIKSESLEDEAELEHQTFFAAATNMRSHSTLTQQLSNLPFAVKLQLLVTLVIVAIVVTESAQLLSYSVDPNAEPSPSACAFAGVMQLITLCMFVGVNNSQ